MVIKLGHSLCCIRVIHFVRLGTILCRSQIFGASREIAEASKFSNVRLLNVQRVSSDQPLYDLKEIILHWTAPHKGSIYVIQGPSLSVHPLQHCTEATISNAAINLCPHSTEAIGLTGMASNLTSSRRLQN